MRRDPRVSALSALTFISRVIPHDPAPEYEAGWDLNVYMYFSLRLPGARTTIWLTELSSLLLLTSYPVCSLLAYIHGLGVGLMMRYSALEGDVTTPTRCILHRGRKGKKYKWYLLIFEEPSRVMILTKSAPFNLPPPPNAYGQTTQLNQSKSSKRPSSSACCTGFLISTTPVFFSLYPRILALVHTILSRRRIDPERGPCLSNNTKSFSASRSFSSSVISPNGSLTGSSESKVWPVMGLTSF